MSDRTELNREGGSAVDVQRKKGILEVCVLAVLKKGPSYGYLIIRELERCVEISESTLYPILKRLEQNGSLKTYRQEYNGRMRKYYQLTPQGQCKIDLFLEEWDELRQMYQFISEQNQMEGEEQAAPAENEKQSGPCPEGQEAGPEKPDGDVRQEEIAADDLTGPDGDAPQEDQYGRTEESVLSERVDSANIVDLNCEEETEI